MESEKFNSRTSLTARQAAMSCHGKRKLDTCETVQSKKHTLVHSILCCMCGSSIKPNPASMCVQCLRNEVDITEGIPQEVVMFSCRGCHRYLGGISWIDCDRESPDMLALCLKRIPGLKRKVRLVDAAFIWTEEHSRRIKVKITIQKDIHGVILQQVLVVEFVVNNQCCDDCQKAACNQAWTSCVQIRQKGVRHKRTMLYLEQLILKHGAHRQASGIATVPGAGLDFFFRERNMARTLVNFLGQMVPMKTTDSRQLISTDMKSNVEKYKFSTIVEIPPICKDDLVCMPDPTARKMADMGNFAICTGVTNVIAVVDPFTLKRGNIDKTKFWKNPFRSMCTKERMFEFTVLNIDPVRGKEGAEALQNSRGKYCLAECEVARTCDLGKNDCTYHIRTHLGFVLKAGDTAMGYLTESAVCNDSDMKELLGETTTGKKRKKVALPAVVLVRKSYPLWRRMQQGKERAFKLKHLALGGAGSDELKAQDMAAESDLRDFMNDLEEDKEMRSQLNLYKNEKFDAAKAGEDQREAIAGGDVEDELPEIDLDELLDDLNLDDADGGPDDQDTAGMDDDDDDEFDDDDL